MQNRPGTLNVSLACSFCGFYSTVFVHSDFWYDPPCLCRFISLVGRCSDTCHQNLLILVDFFIVRGLRVLTCNMDTWPRESVEWPSDHPTLMTLYGQLLLQKMSSSTERDALTQHLSTICKRLLGVGVDALWAHHLSSLLLFFSNPELRTRCLLPAREGSLLVVTLLVT